MQTTPPLASFCLLSILSAVCALLCYHTMASKQWACAQMTCAYGNPFKGSDPSHAATASHFSTSHITFTAPGLLSCAIGDILFAGQATLSSGRRISRRRHGFHANNRIGTCHGEFLLMDLGCWIVPGGQQLFMGQQLYLCNTLSLLTPQCIFWRRHGFHAYSWIGSCCGRGLGARFCLTSVMLF